MMDSNLIGQISLYVDDHKKEFQYGFRAVAAVGIFYALRSVRPIQKFKNATSIPKSFVDRKLKLNGTVIGIESQSSVILRVDHKPIFWARFRRKASPGLAVGISSVNVTSNGIAWLQHMLLEQNVQFLLLKRVENQVYCIVYHQKKNVAEELLKLGFASVQPIDFDLEKEKVYLNYYKSLLQFENKAEKQRLGMWASREYTLLEKVTNKISAVISNIFWRIRGK